MRERLVHGGGGEAGGADQRGRGGDRLALHSVVDREHRRRGAPQSGDAVAIRVDQCQQRIGRARRLHGAHLHALGEKIQPAFPVAAQPHLVEQFVVQRAMFLEEQARVEHRLAQHTVGDQLQHDQQAPEAAVAVEKRVNGLELHMRQRRLDERRRGLRLVVEEALERREAVLQRIGRRRHECRVAGPRTAYPHLRAPHLAGCLAASAGMREQDLVHFTQQAHAQRQPAFQPLQAALQRHHAAAHLARIGYRHAWLLFDLVQQQVRERRLRALDLRRQHRLLAHEAVEQQGRIGQVRGDGIEPAERQQGIVETPAQGRRPLQRRRRRQRRRHEGVERLACRGDSHIPAGSGSLHGLEPNLK